jgi:hypothetical protein
MGKKSVDRYAKPHISVGLGLIQLLYDTTSFGSTNSKFSKTHCKSAFPELLHPKSRVQTSGIIQKLYETKPDAYIRFCISVT